MDKRVERPIRIEKKRGARGDLYRKAFHLYSHSLSRVWQHASRGAMLLSAFRHEKTEEENQEADSQLKGMVNAENLGFFEVDGYYVEDQGKPTETHVQELSLFVPFRPDVMLFGKFLSLASQWVGVFDQDAALVVRPEDQGGGFYEVTRDGSILVESGHVVLDRVAEVYSRLRKGSHKGRPFYFSGFRTPSNSLEAQVMKRHGYRW